MHYTCRPSSCVGENHKSYEDYFPISRRKGTYYVHIICDCAYKVRENTYLHRISVVNAQVSVTIFEGKRLVFTQNFVRL